MSIIEIKVPTMGESVVDAVVGSINKNAGDVVKKDDVIMTLETDKVAVDVVAPKDGKLLEFIVQESSEVKIGALLCTMDDEVVANNVNVADRSKSKINITQTTDPVIQEGAISNDAKLANVSNKNESHSASDKDLALAKDNIGSKNTSSAMQTNSKESDIDSNTNKSPIDNDFAMSKTRDLSMRTREEKSIKMTRLRSRIAERLKQSQNDAAILTTFNEIDMSSLLMLKNKHQDNFLLKHKIKFGFTSFFVKAAAMALLEVPIVNASIDNGYVLHRNYVDIGVAVSTNKGLVVPIIHNADIMDVVAIERDIKVYANKAKNGTIAIDDLTGGTFSITNGGVFGSLLSTPIINPPQSAILGLHAIKDRAVVVDGEVKVRPMMYVALSYDHRIIDGHEAVIFLCSIREYIEDCARMLISV
ncbi:dihydrolipoyltranssuccinylase [Candidatus Xenohaliotis californiensis]|uniref:Dihydrolipoyllysine-residue succinyltransferase n=1 Tax=Candidatus Xenohaliotis californiensis TaxID=84677 RepID=A0ABM9N971_9RICK|nr:dihydrolipoyltranssuccinylase [Candidatus Xenohaliotis californiensis]